MKKFLLSIVAVLAIACMAMGLRAADVNTSNTDLSNVTVTAYQGSTAIISMSGADCAAVFYVLPLDVKTRIANEWDKFTNVASEKGTYAGVKYTFKKDLTLEYNGCKIVATNVTSEMIHKILSNIE